MAVLSGFSGAGKGTLVRQLCEEFDNYVVSVSMTTRQPRANEVNGTHYFFVSNEVFEQSIREDGLLEHAGYVDHYYGTPRAFVDARREEGLDVLLEIEVQGAMQVKEKFSETILIFVTPPSAVELERRLTGRGTDAPETITKRLERALVEAGSMPCYDYVVFNDDLETCVQDINRIIQEEPEDAYRYDAAFAEKFTEELSGVVAQRQRQG